jgi:hypothetical protein
MFADLVQYGICRLFISLVDCDQALDLGARRQLAERARRGVLDDPDLGLFAIGDNLLIHRAFVDEKIDPRDSSMIFSLGAVSLENTTDFPFASKRIPKHRMMSSVR